MLKKDPRPERHQTAALAVKDLEKLRGDLKVESEAGTRSTRRLFWALGLLAACALGIALFAVKWSKPADEPDSPRVVPFTFYPGHEANPAILRLMASRLRSSAKERWL